MLRILYPTYYPSLLLTSLRKYNHTHRVGGVFPSAPASVCLSTHPQPTLISVVADHP